METGSMDMTEKDQFTDEYFKAGDFVNGYCIRRLIGEGRYGIAYLAEDGKSVKYVVKQLKHETLRLMKDDVIFEKSILQSLDYPFFPKYISEFKESGRKGYVLEYMDGSVMEDLLYDTPYVFTKEKIYQIGLRLLDIVEILHKQKIIHGDIRPANVIQMSDQKLALIDFGLARFFDDDKQMKEIDYWYIGDFLIHLYYTTYLDTGKKEKPWFEELVLIPQEIAFLKKLLGIDGSFEDIGEIKDQFMNILQQPEETR